MAKKEGELLPTYFLWWSLNEFRANHNNFAAEPLSCCHEIFSQCFVVWSVLLIPQSSPQAGSAESPCCLAMVWPLKNGLWPNTCPPLDFKLERKYSLDVRAASSASPSCISEHSAFWLVKEHFQFLERKSGRFRDVLSMGGGGEKVFRWTSLLGNFTRTALT